MIERELARLQARPHWGKLFTTSPAVLKGVIRGCRSLIELSRKYDPDGKFRNEFLNKKFFGN